jgi:hypothetical protein
MSIDRRTSNCAHGANDFGLITYNAMQGEQETKTQDNTMPVVQVKFRPKFCLREEKKYDKTQSKPPATKVQEDQNLNPGMQQK